jgi:hypothetical protein
MPFETREELFDLAEHVLERIPADGYPCVVEHATDDRSASVGRSAARAATP